MHTYLNTHSYIKKLVRHVGRVHDQNLTSLEFSKKHSLKAVFFSMASYSEMTWQSLYRPRKWIILQCEVEVYAILSDAITHISHQTLVLAKVIVFLDSINFIHFIQIQINAKMGQFIAQSNERVSHRLVKLNIFDKHNLLAVYLNNRMQLY